MKRLPVLFIITLIITVLFSAPAATETSPRPGSTVLMRGVIIDVQYIIKPGGFGHKDVNKTVLKFEAGQVRIFDQIFDNVVLNKPVTIYQSKVLFGTIYSIVVE